LYFDVSTTRGLWQVRDMWVGLFAKALDPNSDVTAERPFLSILQSLSDADAKIIDLLCFISRKEIELESNLSSVLNAESNENTQTLIAKSRGEMVRIIRLKAEDYALSDLEDSSWSENLMRQGILEAKVEQQFPLRRHSFRSTDERGFIHSLKSMSSEITNSLENARRSDHKPTSLILVTENDQHIRISVQLSTFGKRLAEACDLV
jgi:hypothetical protein